MLSQLDQLETQFSRKVLNFFTSKLTTTQVQSVVQLDYQKPDFNWLCYFMLKRVFILHL